MGKFFGFKCVMRHWSIVTQIVIVSCGIMFVLLLFGSVVFMKFEIAPLVETFTHDYLQKINHTINTREQAEKTLLEKNVKFNSEILFNFGGIFLYHFESEELRHALRLYVNSPEILAVKVLNEDGSPFAAAWKNPDVTEADALPDSLPLDETLSIKKEYIRNEKIIGSFQVYYTDAILTESINTAKKGAFAEAETFRKTSRSRVNQVILHQGIGVVFLLLILVLCLILFLRVSVLKPLDMVSNVARRLSKFDLSVSITTDRKDEIGILLKAIDDMVQSLRNVIGQVQQGGLRVSSLATELSIAVKQQGEIVMSQVNSADSVVNSVDAISSVSAVLVETMQHVATMSQETAEFASSGQADLTRMEDVIQTIGAASLTISEKLGAINEKADNITSVVTTITKVADQTNLLSLNAAIEAEKAGEYGRGFAVVALEIRRLADQTAVAALDIEQMVHMMQSAVSAGVMEMEKFIAEVRQSAEDVHKISTQLTRIIEQVQTLLPNFENINVAMGHQSENALNITEAMMTLSDRLRATMNSLQTSYSSIEQLDSAAKSLQEEVSQFRVS